MFVCPLAYRIFVHVPRGRGPVARFSSDATICIFVFVDDVMFSHDWLYGACNSTTVPPGSKVT